MGLEDMIHAIPADASPLGWHRMLSPTAGVKVSPLCLGTMNFGDAWTSAMGKCTKDTAFDILDFFKANGGNFIDTANNYHNEETETWIGEWMKSRNCRDEIVLATKYTAPLTTYKGYDNMIQVNFGGNNSKSLHISIRQSLKKLQTDYIDVLYVHWWDHLTSISELMHSLNDVVIQGKVLYLGISNAPAWVVSQANEYARNNQLRQFSVYQGLWSAASRDLEREVVPMAKANGMAIATWGALGQGNFKTEEQRQSKEGRDMFPCTEAQEKLSHTLDAMAKRKGTILTSVALAYVMHKAPHVFPIVGGRKIEHLKGNIEALNLELTSEDIQEIENALPFDPTFPNNFIGLKPEDAVLMGCYQNVDYPQGEKILPLGKHKK